MCALMACNRQPASHGIPDRSVKCNMSSYGKPDLGVLNAVTIQSLMLASVMAPLKQQLKPA